jgi:murein DD-endopeptidase MepM/ murein hydrolase activator NlpD
MIFPNLNNRPFGYVNLNEWAQAWLKRAYGRYPNPSPLLKPRICSAFVREVHDTLSLDWSYGGWLEDRTELWQGNYLAEGDKYLHLGVDFNAPVGTSVAIDMGGKIIRVDSDKDQNGGWGTKIAVMLHDANIILIYAHIDLVGLKQGDAVKSAQVIGKIAPSTRNGNWYPHVHVQAMSYPLYSNLVSTGQLDGYGKSSEIFALSRDFPDPLQFVNLK